MEIRDPDGGGAFAFDATGSLLDDIAPPTMAPPVARQVEPTRLDGVLAGLAQLDDEEPAVLRIPRRPGYTLRCGTDLDYEHFTVLKMSARDPSMPLGVNEIALSASVVATLCRAIQLDGEDITENGQPMTLDSPVLHRLLRLGPGTREVDVVRALYAKDGHLAAAANRLITLCGYGATASAEVVPTSGG